MSFEDFMLAISELRQRGYDPQPNEFRCMIDAAHEAEAVDNYLDEYGGGDSREEALTARERNL